VINFVVAKRDNDSRSRFVAGEIGDHTAADGGTGLVGGSDDAMFEQCLARKRHGVILSFEYSRLRAKLRISASERVEASADCDVARVAALTSPIPVMPAPFKNALRLVALGSNPADFIAAPVGLTAAERRA